MDELLEEAMQIIMYSGEARGHFLAAINLAQEGKMDKAKEESEKGKEQLILAHNIQTRVISKECSGTPVNINLLMIHSQDHLMTTMMIKDLLATFFTIGEKINLLQGGERR